MTPPITDTTLHTYHTLLIHLRGGFPDALSAFARQQTLQGIAVRFIVPAETLAGYLSRHPVSREPARLTCRPLIYFRILVKILAIICGWHTAASTACLLRLHVRPA